MTTTTRTTCAYCGVGCGMLVHQEPDATLRIEGDKDHPANHGRLCAKGAALGDTLGPRGRLLHPIIDGRRSSWEQATARVAEGFASAIAEHGPEAVAFYVSGQLLTEDYYVANKLMKGFIGAGNIDTNSRLCMASSVAGHKRAFGEDVVPGCYEDLEVADLVVLVGSNLAWCHPVLHQRLMQARETRGTRIVVIDPRATATTSVADLHLALKPGSDVALYNGLLHQLAREQRLDRGYIAAHTAGVDEALAVADAFPLAVVAQQTGLEAADISAFYELFGATPRAVTVYSQGVNQSSAGTDKVNAIINVHLATGRVGRPGMGPLSVTGQPNAMGGRETGGLANTLAGHIEFSDAAGHAALQDFWQAPALATEPGLKAVDLFAAVAAGQIKALWILGTNPAVSLPESLGVRTALDTCPFVVVSDVIADTDTTRHADVLLPAAGWGEKDGTVTNSERRISRQRAFLPLPAGARPDWRIIADVAAAMGHGAAFDYAGAADIFAEYAAMTGIASTAPRQLKLDRYAAISSADYDQLQPLQWPAPQDSDADATRLYADGGYSTADGRARFVATPFRGPAAQPDEKLPFRLNSGRIRDQWHTMTRTGRAARLSAHIAEPYVEIHPASAAALGINAADLVQVSTGGGDVLVRAMLTQRVARDELFIPMHWSDQFASRARVNVLFPSVTDPVSGQPELKHTPVSVRRFPAVWHGFAVLAQALPPPQADYWARMEITGGWRMELGGVSLPEDMTALFQRLLGAAADRAAVSHYADQSLGQFHFAAFDSEVLLAALYVAREPVAVSRAWVCGQLGKPLDATDAAALLAGRPASDGGDSGAQVCGCMGVGAATIRAAVIAGHDTVNAVGQATQAGTSCGSCRMEIQQIINGLSVKEAV